MDLTTDQEVLDAALTLIHSRQHVSPKRLVAPGPNAEQIAMILGAAGAAPDHGRLNPWRLIIIPPERRACWARPLPRRSPTAMPRRPKCRDRRRTRRHCAARSCCSRSRASIRRWGRHIRRSASGFGRLRNSEHAAGGACDGIRRGPRVSGGALYSQRLRSLFGLGAHEQPLCFLTVGTVINTQVCAAAAKCGLTTRPRFRAGPASNRRYPAVKVTLRFRLTSFNAYR